LLFYVTLKNFLLYGDVTITGEGLQNFGQCSALRAFEQEGIFSWHGASVFLSHPKDRPIHLPLAKHKGMWRIYSNPNPHGSSFSFLLRHARVCWGPILTRILTGLYMNVNCQLATCMKSPRFAKNKIEK
jgi:hypothetical protein